MEEKLKNLEPDLLALAEALRDMPWVDQVEITRIRESDHYEMRAYMWEDPKGLLRDVRPERIDSIGVFWRRARDVGPCTLVMYNTNKMEQAYRAKWDLEPLGAGGGGGHGYGGGKGGAGNGHACGI